jgi:hypothetical protein
MTQAMNDEIKYDRPHRALGTPARRRVIDGYPAGYVAELARAFLVQADQRPIKRRQRPPSPGFRTATAVRVGG